jgi:hypothetical protein
MALANADRVPAIVATALLALATVVILGLSLATLKGLRAGTLLVAEPGAPVIPVVPAGR